MSTQRKVRTYADYGKGRELRQLVDQLDTMQEKAARAVATLTDCVQEAERIGLVMAALASAARRT